MASSRNPSNPAIAHPRQHVVSIRGQPVFLQEDWNHGIGGGLWSTGLALAKYLDTEHAQTQLSEKQIRRALELGSGNGFLSVCLAAAASSTLEEVVVTDTKEHLPLMQSTIDANGDIFVNGTCRTQVLIQEYLWGTGPLRCSSGESKAFDLIIGSDLAYRDELHDPLIQAILDCSNATTVVLLGVTMNDTKPKFFSKLTQQGLRYERLADHCLEPSFRGTNFGIFVIQRHGKGAV